MRCLRSSLPAGPTFKYYPFTDAFRQTVPETAEVTAARAVHLATNVTVRLVPVASTFHKMVPQVVVAQPSVTIQDTVTIQSEVWPVEVEPTALTKKPLQRSRPLGPALGRLGRPSIRSRHDVHAAKIVFFCSFNEAADRSGYNYKRIKN